MTLIVLAILVALLVIVLMQLFKKSPPPPRPTGPDLANLKVTDARNGDVLSIIGAGDELTDLDFTVDRTTRYEAGARRWYELGGAYRERRVALRIAGEEEVEVCLHNDRGPLSLEDLGLAEEDLAQMDERQNTADSFEFDGKVWLYRRSHEAQAWRNGQSLPTRFYYWEFQEQDSKGLITIRKAEGEPFAVTRYIEIPAGNVSVFRGSTTS